MSIHQPAERVAALYDIHGNMPALEAVLRAIARTGVSCVVVGGDVVLGPMPVQVLERLAMVAVPVQFLSGNCDRLVVEAASGRLAATLPAQIRALVEWTAAQLSSQQLEFLASLPQTVRLEIAGLGAVRFCHATPRSDEEIVTPRTPDDQVRAMLEGTEESLVVCGHTHVQFRREVALWQLLNAGSVGMSTRASEAHWLLLGAEAAWQQTPYDPGAATESIGATSYPGALAFIGNHIQSSPTADAVWAMLEPATG